MPAENTGMRLSEAASMACVTLLVPSWAPAWLFRLALSTVGWLLWLA